MSTFLFGSPYQLSDIRHIYIPTTLIHSCMRHTTVQPTNAGIDGKAESLAADLQDLDVVTSAEQSDHEGRVVRFKCTDDVRRMPPSVMGVLADHGADLGGGCLDGTFYSGRTGWSAMLPEQ